MRDPPYAEFGNLLAMLRREAGIAQQLQLAELVKVSQQTVSRWEAGVCRPHASQIPLLARTLQIKATKLLAAAGYAPKMMVASFDKPFPIDGLSPQNFERFCQSALEYLYPDAEVHIARAQGRTQEGMDVDVVFPDGTRHTGFVYLFWHT